MSEPFTNFSNFWLHYLNEHSDALNRRLHLIGTTAALATAVLAIALGKPALLLLIPLVGYGPAWIGHFLVERNRPATLSHPLWSLRADLKMWALFLTGRLQGELNRAKELPQQFRCKSQ